MYMVHKEGPSWGLLYVGGFIWNILHRHAALIHHFS